MKPVVLPALTAAGAGQAVPVDFHLTQQQLGVSIIITGTLVTKLQWTLDDPFSATFAANATWFDDKNLVTLSASTAGVPVNAAGFIQPVRAVRLNNTAYTSGGATLTVMQSGGIS